MVGEQPSVERKLMPYMLALPIQWKKNRKVANEARSLSKRWNMMLLLRSDKPALEPNDTYLISTVILQNKSIPQL